MQKGRTVVATASNNVEGHDPTPEAYRKNMDLSLQWIRWLLKAISAWPNSRKQSPIAKCSSWLIIAIYCSLITFLLVPYTAFMILEVEGAYNKIRSVGPLSFFLMSFAKYYLLIHHGADLRRVVSSIEWDWENINFIEDRNIMVAYANYGRKLMAICAFFVYGSYVCYYFILIPSLGKIVSEEENLTYAAHAFPFSSYIADVRHSPLNEIVFFLQALTGMLLHTISTAACSLVAVFACHACGQMQVLMCWLEHLIDGRSGMSENVDSRIADIVQQHVRVLKWVKMYRAQLEKCPLDGVMTPQDGGRNLYRDTNVHRQGKECNMTEVTYCVSYITLIASFVFNIFVFCYVGELVVGQCDKIGEVSYMIEWYRMSGKKKLCCVLFIEMSNASIKLTAGNLVELSINTFSEPSKVHRYANITIRNKRGTGCDIGFTLEIMLLMILSSSSDSRNMEHNVHITRVRIREALLMFATRKKASGTR